MTKQLIPVVIGVGCLCIYMLWDMISIYIKQKDNPPMEKLFNKPEPPTYEELLDKVAKDIMEKQAKDADEETIDRFTAAYLNDLILKKTREKTN